MFSDEMMDKFKNLFEEMSEDIKQSKSIKDIVEDYINGQIDIDIKENEERWSKLIDSFVDPILESMGKLDKASSQMAIMNGIINLLEQHRKLIFKGIAQRFKNDNNKIN